MRRSRMLTMAGLLVPVLLLGGCDTDLLSDGSGSTATGVVVPPPTPGGCGQPGPLVSQQLPVFDPSDEHQAGIQALRNPCLPLGDVAGLVDGLIPAPEAEKTAIRTFRHEVHRVAGRFLAVADAVECGYETDRLAIGIYHHAEDPWSVGVVVVVRGSFAAVGAVVACYLLDWTPLSGDYRVRAAGNRPAPEFCAFTGAPGDYALVALGSSTWMCEALPKAMRGLSARMGT